MKIDKIIENLKRNNMDAYYVENRQQACQLAKTFIKKGDTVSCGGSMTLNEAGIDKILANGEYNFLDRSAPGLTPDEITEIYRGTFFADAYFCSANALTENGELVNVDGRANRVAAITYGPESVICIVGINKIVADVPAGFRRIKEIAAPLNAKRLSCKTPCAATGKCIALCGGIADGCRSSDRICATYAVFGQQRVKNRIKVIIVGENLGY